MDYINPADLLATGLITVLALGLVALLLILWVEGPRER